MGQFQRVPLAWLNLFHNKGRFVVSLAGISFAVLLMFMEVGFQYALLDATVELIRLLDGDLVILSRSKYALPIKGAFPKERLSLAQGVSGVKAAYPLYVEYRFGFWRNPEDRTRPPRPIRVIAFNPSDPILRMPEVNQQVEKLRLPGNVLMDRKSKREFGVVRAGLDRELADQAIHVVGLFQLGTDFGTDGNLILSDRQYAKLFPSGPLPEDTLSKVDVGVVQKKPGADLRAVKDALIQAMPEDVYILTKEEFMDQESAFWSKHTPIGFIFGLGTWMGFIVGVVIIYQILSADVADHLPEFATLKAIGYANRYLSGVVLREALLLSLVGYVPGLVFSWLLYVLLESQTGLPMKMTLGRGGFILFLTVSMCVLSGFLALRRVQTADPAEVF